jgi:hypothetical protein
VLPAAAQAAPASPGAVQALIADGVWTCNNIGNGELCIRYIQGKTGVDVKYHKVSGAAITARFTYRDYTYVENHYDAGSFRQIAGQTKSYAWHYTYPGCVRGFLNTSSGQFLTPYICP